MYLSTLAKYVEALGGELQILVKMPNKEPVQLIDLPGLL